MTEAPVRTSTAAIGAGATLEGATPSMTAYVARPAAGSGPWPGVVLLHEAFGLQDVTRRQVEHLASLGYVVAAPDLYAAGGTARCLVPTFRAATSGSGQAYTDIEAARRWLLAEPDVTDHVGIIGFCMGGAFALQTVTRGFDASAPCYGQLPQAPEVLRGGCPVVASYGARDRSLEGASAKLECALTAYGVPHDVKEYPNSGHRFMNAYDDLPAITRPLQRVMGVGPNPADAADAWTRIDAFFGEHLR
ncbi:dienelactone hydrolase family protein [Agilicoccus flavus]|uniref:dienelactone hydrolase family protein n=1 Tax=Agilicoccus flavus TaxID=2775968 RepID=UPI001CF66932|nr:dienelactone hydrolase family protein [Agilicoccus flavus]